MSKININDLQSTGADLFSDSESFLDELRSDELGNVAGGAFAPSATISQPTVVNPLTTTLGTTIIQTRTLTPTVPTGGPWSPVIL